MTFAVPAPSIWPPAKPTGLADGDSMSELGRALIVLGIVVAVVGVILVLFDHVPWIGRLPGDIRVQRGNWTFYFPLGTYILISVVLTLVLWLIGRR
jgi:hypothetical protein